MSCDCRYQTSYRKAEVDEIRVDLCFDDILKPTEELGTVQWWMSSQDDPNQPDFDPNGIRIAKQILPIEGDSVSAMVSGGEAGKTYTVCAEVDTSDNQRAQRCALIAVKSCP